MIISCEKCIDDLLEIDEAIGSRLVEMSKFFIESDFEAFELKRALSEDTKIISYRKIVPFIKLEFEKLIDLYKFISLDENNNYI